MQKIKSYISPVSSFKTKRQIILITGGVLSKIYQNNEANLLSLTSFKSLKRFMQ